SMSVKVSPPLVDTCHRTVGSGRPDAAAVNVTVPPATTVRSAGSVVTVGAARTVRVAALVVAVFATFVNTARYRYPCWVVSAVKLRVADVAPVRSDQAPPLS